MPKPRQRRKSAAVQRQGLHRLGEPGGGLRGLNDPDKARRRAGPRTSFAGTGSEDQPARCGSAVAAGTALRPEEAARQALARVQTALALSPDDPDVLESVGETYESAGRPPARDSSPSKKACRRAIRWSRSRTDPLLQEFVVRSEFPAQYQINRNAEGETLWQPQESIRIQRMVISIDIQRRRQLPPASRSEISDTVSFLQRRGIPGGHPVRLRQRPVFNNIANIARNGSSVGQSPQKPRSRPTT